MVFRQSYKEEYQKYKKSLLYYFDSNTKNNNFLRMNCASSVIGKLLTKCFSLETNCKLFNRALLGVDKEAQITNIIYKKKNNNKTSIVRNTQRQIC